MNDARNGNPLSLNHLLSRVSKIYLSRRKTFMGLFFCVNYGFISFPFPFLLQGFEGVKSGLAAVVTLASSVDYTSSKSSLKLLLPLVRRPQ